MIPQLLLMPLAFGILASNPSVATQGAPHHVTIDVLVCEGMELKFWFNDEAEKKWATCAKPIKGIPLAIAGIPDGPEPIETDAKGHAQLGPIALVAEQKFRVAMGGTSHHNLAVQDLFVGSGFIHDGRNKLIIFTVPNSPSPATKPSGGS